MIDSSAFKVLIINIYSLDEKMICKSCTDCDSLFSYYGQRKEKAFKLISKYNEHVKVHF